MKQFIRHMDGMAKYQIAHATAKAMAEHCDKRVENLRKAILQEEKYLHKLLRSKTAGGVMSGDIEGAFHRLMAALDEPPTKAKRRSAHTGGQ